MQKCLESGMKVSTISRSLQSGDDLNILEAVVQTCSVKKMLLKVSQNS